MRDGKFQIGNGSNVNWCTAASQAKEVAQLLQAHWKTLRDTDPNKAIISDRFVFWKHLHEEVDTLWTAVSEAPIGGKVSLDREMMFMVAFWAEILLKDREDLSGKEKGRLDAVKKVSEENKGVWAKYLQHGEVTDADTKMPDGTPFIEYARAQGVFTPRE